MYKQRETLNILTDETSVFSRENETNEPFIMSMKALRLKITLRISFFFKGASVEIKYVMGVLSQEDSTLATAFFFYFLQFQKKMSLPSPVRCHLLSSR